MVTATNVLPAVLVEHLHRYRLTTAAIVQIRGLCGGSTAEEAEKVLDVFVSQGSLQKAPLTLANNSPACYWLSQKAAKQFGVADASARHHSLNDRLSHWAISQFCAATQPFRELLTQKEFCERFSALWRPGQPHRYYLQPTQEGVSLSFLKVDLGGASRWDRVVDSCYRFLAKRTQRSTADGGLAAPSELYAQLIANHRFQMSLLVASPEKAGAINARLDLDAVEHGVRAPIVPYVVPGLMNLLLSTLPDRRGRSRRRRRRLRKQDSRLKR